MTSMETVGPADCTDDSGYLELAETACPGRGPLIASQFPRASQLVAATTTELRAAGLDEMEADRLFAAFSLSRSARAPRSRTKVISVDSAAEILVGHLADSIAERVVALALDRRHALITTVLVAEGGLDRTQIDPRVLFGKLVRVGASSAVLGHSHPSGDPAPSMADIRTTERLCEAGALLDIEIVDHLVVAGDQWISMRDAGLM